MAGNRLNNLELMRSQRDRREAEAQAPVWGMVYKERRAKEDAIGRYQQIEFKLGQDIIKYAMELSKQKIAIALREQLIKILPKIGPSTYTINLSFPTFNFKIAEPDKQLQFVLKEYIRLSKPSLKIEDIPSNRTQLVQIHIPALNIHFPVDK